VEADGEEAREGAPCAMLRSEQCISPQDQDAFCLLQIANLSEVSKGSLERGQKGLDEAGALVLRGTDSFS